MSSNETSSVNNTGKGATTAAAQVNTAIQSSSSKHVVVPRGYSISQSGRSFISSAAEVQMEEGKASQSSTPSYEPSIIEQMTMGGSIFDGFLLAASQEVGQSILTLPNVFSKTGFAGGISLELLFATLALYTNYLLVSMHAQHRYNMKIDGTKEHNDPYHIVSYHEIMGSLVGKKMKLFSLTVVFFALLGLSTVQIIATVSNLYLLREDISKRTWALISGGIFSCIAFVPTFRHYRAISVLGILTTTYTAWYMTATSIIVGPSEDTLYDAPTSVESFFQGFVQLLFVYGGHSSNIEVADVMDNPATYDESYFWSYIYVFTLTMPNAVAAYYAYSQEAGYNTNAFALFPQSNARDVGIIMMSLHQAVAFGLFAGPLFHMWEKLIHIHDRPFIVRAFSRLPLCGMMLLLAVAFPFWGAINGILGAFTTSFGTYIIPCIAYNLAFHSKDDLVKQPVMNFKFMRAFNWAVTVFVLTCGVGFGGYTSIKSYLRQLDQFDYFSECYQC
jgi:auxin influx carrier (AUX1 LAX family)